MVLGSEAVEQAAREFGWQDVWMTQPATAKAKAETLLTAMSGAMNSSVRSNKRAVWQQGDEPAAPAKARRAGVSQCPNPLLR